MLPYHHPAVPRANLCGLYGFLLFFSLSSSPREFFAQTIGGDTRPYLSVQTILENRSGLAALIECVAGFYGEGQQGYVAEYL